jgi:hypothetical protein
MMAVITQAHSERKSEERRQKRAEEAAAKELERTVKANEEHRSAVEGDAKAGDRPQRKAGRHTEGVVNVAGVPQEEKRGGKRSE